MNRNSRSKSFGTGVFLCPSYPLLGIAWNALSIDDLRTYPIAFEECRPNGETTDTLLMIGLAA